MPVRSPLLAVKAAGIPAIHLRRGQSIAPARAAAIRDTFARQGVLGIAGSVHWRCLQGVYRWADALLEHLPVPALDEDLTFCGFPVQRHAHHLVVYCGTPTEEVEQYREKPFVRMAQRLAADCTSLTHTMQQILQFPAPGHACPLDANHMDLMVHSQPAPGGMEEHVDAANHISFILPATRPGLELLWNGTWIDAWFPGAVLMIAGGGFDRCPPIKHRVRIMAPDTTRTVATFAI